MKLRNKSVEVSKQAELDDSSDVELEKSKKSKRAAQATKKAAKSSKANKENGSSKDQNDHESSTASKYFKGESIDKSKRQSKVSKSAQSLQESNVQNVVTSRAQPNIMPVLTDNIESNIDLLLQMEKVSNNKVEEFMDDDDESEEETRPKTSKGTKKVRSDDSEDEWEEVEMNHVDLSKVGRDKPIEVVINDKKAKKPVDQKAKMERMFKAMQKKLYIITLKADLVCWISHGFYLNRLCLDPELRALVMSQPLFNLQNLSSKENLGASLKMLAKSLIENQSSNNFLDSVPIDSESIKTAIAELNIPNYLHYLVILIIALRNSGLRVRLCVNFDTVKFPEGTVSKRATRNLSINPNSKKSREKAAAQKRKSEPIPVVVEPKKPKVENSKRNSAKSALKKLKDVSDSSDEEDKKPKKSKKVKQEDQEFKMDEETIDEIKSEPSVKPDNSLEEDFATFRPKLVKNKPLLKNGKILSSEDEAESMVTDQVKENTEELSSIAYKNYWIEVYLEEEQSWCAVEPLTCKLDCASMIEPRFGKQVLYVVGFDNDNRIKDVTKRYSSDWCITTRLLRVSHLEEKKLWWERAMLLHQPLDYGLDIQEEKQLKEMLLKNEIPQSVSEFKDHPLYLLPRHLLKFQAVYPKNATPITHFRQEPVYSRDNLVTLHSRQTWLKYARVVKPFEKPYKIVKGRLKLSEYKAGQRDNPDLDLYGFWQTKEYEPPIAEGGRVPRNEFGNVELFQPNMLPRGCVHLRNMPNLIKTCRKLNIDCAAAVIGFDAHGGFSHAVTDGWVVCEEVKDIVIAAYQEDEREANRKMLEKRQERIWNNWKRLTQTLLIRERLKLKYDTFNKDGKHVKKQSASKQIKNAMEKHATRLDENNKHDELDEMDEDKRDLVGGRLNSLLKKNEEAVTMNTETIGEKSNIIQIKKKAVKKKTTKRGKNKKSQESSEDEQEYDSDTEYEDFKPLKRRSTPRRAVAAKKQAIIESDPDLHVEKPSSPTEKVEFKLSESESE